MQKIFLIDLFVSGGPVMIPIVLCSVFALAIVFERARFYMRNPSTSPAFMKKVKAAVASHNYFDAMKICRAENTPLANVIAAGLDNADLGREHLLDVMRQEAMVQVKKFERHLGKLSTIASITPLLGLTGTVTGMISAFSVISTVGIGDPTALAGGISEALYTTAAGLLVGIPSLVAYNWCEAKNFEFIEQVEMHSLDLANQVTAMEVGLEKLLPDKRKQKPQIVVTNLIDVILLLVFFFMITSSFARNQEKLPINVPKASTATTMETDNMTVQIAKNGRIHISGKPVEMTDLTGHITTWVTNSPDRPVMVEADKDANYGRIIFVLDAIRNSGAVNIGLSTRPEAK